MLKSPFKEKTLEGSELILNGVKNQVTLIQENMKDQGEAIEVDLGVMEGDQGAMNADAHLTKEEGEVIAANQVKAQEEAKEEIPQALRVK